MPTSVNGDVPKGPYKPLVIIHGGAGSITRAGLPPMLYDQYQISLRSYLESTYAVLDGVQLPSTQSVDAFSPGHASGPTNAVDAVVHAISMLECDPLFNCSRGAVFTSAGTIELEASLAIASIHPSTSSSTSASRHLPGLIKRSAAVSMLKHTKHPIQLAREVLKMADERHHEDNVNVCERDWENPGQMHGHLSGDWVEQWGAKMGLEQVKQKWFWTRKRWEEHKRGLGNPFSEDEWIQVLSSSTQGQEGNQNIKISPEEKLLGDKLYELLSSIHDLPSQGTVGCVCMDTWGNIAVGTSTGGLTNKTPGRIGDTPTVGAGFWAESWDEQVQVPSMRELSEFQNDSQNSPDDHHPAQNEPGFRPIFHNLTNMVSQEVRRWLGDCLPGLQRQTRGLQSSSTSIFAPQPPRSLPSFQFPISTSTASTTVEKQPLLHHDRLYLHHPTLTTTTPYAIPVSSFISKPRSKYRTRHHAVAISGTGNGDSFLRTNAVRTAAAISRFTGASLAHGVTSVAGPGGELQRSAGDRWQKTGEGEGGMIAIEVIGTEDEGTGLGGDHDDSTSSGTRMEIEAKVVFDFNCGGMWRAYFEKDGDGVMKPKVMVFKEEY